MTASSSPTKSKTHTPIILLFVIALFCAMGGVGLYIQNQNRILNIAQQKQIEADKKKENEQRRKQLQALYDSYLNDFKKELREKATDYKNARTVLKEIKNPGNFETPDYAKENYKIFKESIAPSLRQKAVDIINVFETYSKKIETNLKDKNNELQQTFLIQWKEMNQKQLMKYVDFFSKEEDLVQAYDDLITFYYVHSRLYEVDPETNQFKFSRKEDEKKATELLNYIETLQKPPVIKKKANP